VFSCFFCSLKFYFIVFIYLHLFREKKNWKAKKTKKTKKNKKKRKKKEKKKVTA